MPKLLRWAGVALIVAVVDQISKALVSRWLEPNGIHRVNDNFDMVLAHNRGAAFSFLAQAGGWQRFFFSGLAIAAIAIISRLIYRNNDKPRLCLGLSLILGGAVGNLVDRILVGTVTDFIQWHAGGFYWPAFNVADAAITVGVVILIWDNFARQT
jgi:signal peptidase II